VRGYARSAKAYKIKEIDFKDNEYIKSLQLWRSKFVQKVIIKRSDNVCIEAGTNTGGLCDIGIFEPESADDIPFVFGLCQVFEYPTSGIAGFGFSTKHKVTGEIKQGKLRNLQENKPFMLQDYH
jgi:hypothetical protein